MSYVLQLPYPPSLNAYYVPARAFVKGGGRQAWGKRISPEGMAYRGEVQRVVRKGHQVPPRITGRLAVLVYAMPPNMSRKRDLDNLWKCLLDALTKAEVVLDDSQYDDIRMVRGKVVAGGAVYVAISRFDVTAAFHAVTEAGIKADTPDMPVDLFEV